MDIATTFNLKDKELYFYNDILIELNLPWENADAYQLSVGGQVRNIEHYNVSPCGHIAFFDDESRQLTVLSLIHNHTEEQYSYRGKLLWSLRRGKQFCEVRVFVNNRTICLTHHKPAGRRRIAIDDKVELKDTPQNRELLRIQFEQRSRTIQ